MRMMDVHGELSKLHHAIKLEMEPYAVGIELRYRTNGLYLSAVIVCPSHRVRAICVERLTRGAIQQKYDYRFKGICHTPDAADGEQVVEAYVDLSYEPKKVAA